MYLYAHTSSFPAEGFCCCGDLPGAGLSRCYILGEKSSNYEWAPVIVVTWQGSSYWITLHTKKKLFHRGQNNSRAGRALAYPNLILYTPCGLPQASQEWSPSAKPGINPGPKQKQNKKYFIRWNHAICCKLDGSRGCHIEPRRSEGERQT